MTDEPAPPPLDPPPAAAPPVAEAFDCLVIIDPLAAPGHMRILAMAYDDVERARMIRDEHDKATKAAKAAYDRAVNHVLDIVRDATRPRSMPLFDAAEAEADRDRMTSAAGG